MLTVTDNVARVELLLDDDWVEVEMPFVTNREVVPGYGFEIEFGKMTIVDGREVSENEVIFAYEGTHDGDLELAVMDAHVIDCADNY